ncbi:hypothetical protein DQM68_04015 [Leptospira mayottensis]|uniref:Uncharacterized protein n=1 Tax=Leptospira mayottensis TaxID=1137606 RepID=A0ABN5NNW2_9LEPT|nr:hypothetical protein DQM68_04015 [Leptospira mayottensis]AXR63751.1 hypothetical protein DQM28_05445 [Leptospira mayottensis]AZQ03585.1 hypothetical protein LEP1GSC190_17720 [Leptospira mayottensis 200901116]TGN17253.1 hypothetical protein EHR03_02200 [Leptospira mayottensis]
MIQRTHVTAEWLLCLFISSLLGIIPLIVLYSIFRKMRDKKVFSIFNYTFEISLLIIMPIVMYLGLIEIYDRQMILGMLSAPFLGLILTILFIVYFEFVERSVKVKFSIFLILAWICTGLTWLLFPGKML